MFWGLVLEPSKKYTQKVDHTFHISQASLDLKSCDQEPVQLVVEYENSNFVLATLSKKANIFQVPLDLIFKTGDQVSFRTIGNGKVHLSGYHILDDLNNMMMNGEEESDLEELEEEEDEDEEEENTKGKGKRKKPTPDKKGGKKAKLGGNEDGSDLDDEEDDDDDDDEDDEDEESDDDLMLGKKGNKKNGFLDDEAEEDEDDDLDDLDDLDEEDDFEDEDDDDESENDEEEVIKKTSKSEKKKNVSQTLNGTPSASKGKDKSAQKLNKSKSDSQIETPKSESKGGKNKKNKFNNTMNENTPQKKGEEGLKNAEKNKSPKQQDGSPQKKVLEGGVISEELRVGNGPVAKPGKMANVYYVGTLQSTKKQFDSVQNGPGFKFRIGRNEVIKGWDIGVNGMKVGGKRRLTIPPHLAYGAKGSPPVIPPNSTLVFTVELKGVS